VFGCAIKYFGFRILGWLKRSVAARQLIEAPCCATWVLGNRPSRCSFLVLYNVKHCAPGAGGVALSLQLAIILFNLSGLSVPYFWRMLSLIRSFSRSKVWVIIMLEVYFGINVPL
jgi:hypothetical protein